MKHSVNCWTDNSGSDILIPVGPRCQLTTFLIETGAQISILPQQDAKKAGAQLRQQRVKIPGVDGASVSCKTALVNLWLLGERHRPSAHLAGKNHNENVLGLMFEGSNLACAGRQRVVLQLRYQPLTGWEFGIYITGAPRSTRTPQFQNH